MPSQHTHGVGQERVRWNYETAEKQHATSTVNRLRGGSRKPEHDVFFWNFGKGLLPLRISRFRSIAKTKASREPNIGRTRRD